MPALGPDALPSPGQHHRRRHTAACPPGKHSHVRSSGLAASSPHRARRRRPAALLAAVVVLAAVMAGCSGPTNKPRPTPTRTPTDAASLAKRFLAYATEPDGRVRRPDQGNDTVSESQAYGLLLAEVAGDDLAFARIWGWTAANLQRSDHLLSWHWKGNVTDPEPAGDADLLAAWALTRYAGSDAGRFHAAGATLAAAVAAHEVATGPRGPVLAAGPWALKTKPPLVNPSYWSSQAYTGLAGALPDQKIWPAMSAAVAPTLSALTRSGVGLPPDWAVLTTASITPTPAPGGSARSHAMYGLDAQRTVVWAGFSCHAAERSLAGKWWSQLDSGPVHQAAVSLMLSGGVVDDTPSPLGLVASAAAATGAGAEPDAGHLMAQAISLSAQHPTYYGSAWVALGQALREGKLGGHCPST